MRELTPDDAAAALVAHMGLMHTRYRPGLAGVRELLKDRRCIQLDPLQPIASNADLVAMARVADLHRGEVYDALLPSHAFEHYSKERCLIPASCFATWRQAAQTTPLWRSSERMRQLPAEIVEAVYQEVHRRGPIAVSQLSERGRVEPADHSGWKTTPKLATLAIAVLWRQCRVVVCGRQGRGKVVDIPERALPQSLDNAEDFDRAVLLDRVWAAGLLSTLSGPHWSMLGHLRGGELVDALVASGQLERVTVRGSRRQYLTVPGFGVRPRRDYDDAMRILGPLDPLLWDRKLVHHAFDFEYVWEVYKPAEKRRWGWYVVPLLHRGRLVARLEAHREGGELVVDTLWREPGQHFDEQAFSAMLARYTPLLQPRVSE